MNDFHSWFSLNTISPIALIVKQEPPTNETQIHYIGCFLEHQLGIINGDLGPKPKEVLYSEVAFVQHHQAIRLSI